MPSISREWATPLTIGTFGVMAVTGGLMFFHLDGGLQKSVHEWLGWGMVAAVAAHASVNWPAFKRYLRLPARSGLILAAFAVLLAGTFLVTPASEGGAPPPVLAMRAVAKLPLKDLTALTGKPVEQILGELAAAGLQVDDAEQSIEGIAGGDRELTGRAMRALFQEQGRQARG